MARWVKRCRQDSSCNSDSDPNPVGDMVPKPRLRMALEASLRLIKPGDIMAGSEAIWEYPSARRVSQILEVTSSRSMRPSLTEVTVSIVWFCCAMIQFRSFCFSRTSSWIDITVCRMLSMSPEMIQLFVILLLRNLCYDMMLLNNSSYRGDDLDGEIRTKPTTWTECHTLYTIGK